MNFKKQSILICKHDNNIAMKNNFHNDIIIIKIIVELKFASREVSIFGYKLHEKNKHMFLSINIIHIYVIYIR